MASGSSIRRRDWLRFAGAVGAAAMLSPQRDVNADDSDSISSESTETSVERLIYQEPKVQDWRIGLILKTPVACTNVFATFPIPRDWPEQKVTLVDQRIDPLVTKWETREVASGAKQVALAMNRVPANSTVEMTLQIKVEKTLILSSQTNDDLVIPKKITRELRPFFGNSPHIDASNARIKKVSRELAAEESDNAWQRVEKIYDWVRSNVKYTEGELKNASAALKDGRGDCEEMTSLVVALCRNARIPSRMVWVHDHCYPEFYLEDGGGKGYWFPCQAAGTRQFGQMEEYRPILQKGDRFKVKETKTPVRYVAEFFRCDKQGKGKPKPVFIREPITV
jgi:transglutaminase-like putative cysteine protease